MRYCLLLYLALFVACQSEPDANQVHGVLQKSAELATTEFVLTKIISATKSNKVLGLRVTPDATFMASTEARIKTGIDLTQLKPKHVQVEEKTVRVKLPAVKLLHFSYPPDKMEMIQEYTRKNYFNAFSIQEKIKLYQQAETEIRNHLQEYGFYDEAEANTKQLFTHLLTSMGFERVEVSFQETAE